MGLSFTRFTILLFRSDSDRRCSQWRSSTRRRCHLVPFFATRTQAVRSQRRWAADERHRPTAVSSPVIWPEGKVNLHNSEKIRREPQIALLDLGLRPGGQGALVLTGGPGGDGADGSCRRAEGPCGLCGVPRPSPSYLLRSSPSLPSAARKEQGSSGLPGTAPVQGQRWDRDRVKCDSVAVLFLFTSPEVGPPF